MGSPQPPLPCPWSPVPLQSFSLRRSKPQWGCGGLTVPGAWNKVPADQSLPGGSTQPTLRPGHGWEMSAHGGGGARRPFELLRPSGQERWVTTDRLTARKQDTSQPARNLLSGLAPHPGPDLWAPHLGGSRNQQTRERPGVPAAQDEGCPHEPRDSGFQLWTGRLLLQKGTPASGPPAPTRPSPHSPASS